MAKNTRYYNFRQHSNVRQIRGDQTPIAIKYDPQYTDANGQMIPIKVYAPTVKLEGWLASLEDLLNK